MKIKYNLSLLVSGIAIILTQIAAYVLKSRYAFDTYLTVGFRFDIFVMLAISFIYILQFKGFEKLVSIILVVYGAINILYGISVSSTIRGVIHDTDIEVLFMLGLLLGHALYAIASLFILVHSTQTKFETKFTKRFVLIALCISLGLLALITPFITHNNLQSIVVTISSLLAIAAVYTGQYYLITDKPVIEEKEITPVVKSQQDELDSLLRRGLITQQEYDYRKNKL